MGAASTAKSASAPITEEEVVETPLNIYPNPVESTLFFTTEVSGNVSIVDAQTGASVSSQKINGNNVDVSRLRTGIYLIVLEKDGQKTIKRFIKK